MKHSQSSFDLLEQSLWRRGVTRPLNNISPLYIEMIASTIQTGVEKVWATLGSGHSEIIYQNALRIELSKSKEIHHLSSGRVVPITYEGFSVGSCVLDLDFVTNFDQMVILELKSIRALRSDDHMQILRYTRLFGNVIGFLINFPTGDAKPEIHEFVGEEGR